jgi:hypothetical protein
VRTRQERQGLPEPLVVRHRYQEPVRSKSVGEAEIPTKEMPTQAYWRELSGWAWARLATTL